LIEESQNQRESSKGGRIEDRSFIRICRTCEMKIHRLLLCCLSLCLCAQGQARAGTLIASVGDRVPDCELIDQNGRVCHLHQFKGQALAFTFIFTRCPLVAYCPRMTERFLEVQRELAADHAAADWRLLSLSFDPEHDTPAQLSAYATAHHIETDRWTLATGAAGVVRAFGAAFGLTAEMEEGLLNHNLRTVVVDRRRIQLQDVEAAARPQEGGCVAAVLAGGHRDATRCRGELREGARRGDRVADDGVIDMDEEFSSGDTEPPAHVNCRCAVAPVVIEEPTREEE
jgi:cytochrome oxidase Cu insertion factor (SCO1/SenC/PrrC family)